MRKLLVSLIILIVAGGVVFYFGWVQFRLAPGTYAVLFSKTNGYDPAVIRPGTFVWKWQALLPTNVTLLQFPLTRQQSDLTVNGTLPSSALYGEYLAGHPAFSYRLSFTVVYVLRSETLPTLVTRDHLMPSGLDNWYQGIASQCRSVAEQFLLSPSTASDFASPQRLQSALATKLEQTFPNIRFVDVSLSTIDLPDLPLYEQAKQQYLALVRAEQSVRESAAIKKTTLEAEAAQKIALLSRYGELFNQYPVLLKYLALNPSNRQNVIPGF